MANKIQADAASALDGNSEVVIETIAACGTRHQPVISNNYGSLCNTKAGARIGGMGILVRSRRI